MWMFLIWGFLEIELQLSGWGLYRYAARSGLLYDLATIYHIRFLPIAFCKYFVIHLKLFHFKIQHENSDRIIDLFFDVVAGKPINKKSLEPTHSICMLDMKWVPLIRYSCAASSTIKSFIMPFLERFFILSLKESSWIIMSWKFIFINHWNENIVGIFWFLDCSD